MKIAIVHRYYPMPGGVTTLVKEMRKEFDKRGIDYEIITQKSIKNDKKVKSLPGKYAFPFYFRCTKYIRSNKFNVIHTHSSPLTLFTHFLDEKIILTIHGFEKDQEISTFFKSFFYNQIMGRIKVLSYKMSDCIVPTSTLLVENLSKNYNISKDKMAIIPSCVNTHFFKPLRVVKKSSKVRIFQFSTSNRKGFNYIISWMKDLSKIKEKFEFVVVAGEAEKVPPEYKKYFNVSGIVPYKDMPKIYNSCDIIILPSILDPFGLTPGEGMACGKVPIITPFCGIKDIIDNGVDGFVCDFDEFPKKIELLITNSKLRKEMSSKTRKKVMERISVEKVAEEYINLYRKFIND